MPTQTTDYEAIAKKYGGVADAPKPKQGASVDYAALAKKYGGAVVDVSPKQSANNDQASVDLTPQQEAKNLSKSQADYSTIAAKHGGEDVSRFIKESKTDIAAQFDPRKNLYDATIAEGQTPERANVRLREYDYGIKNGMKPDKAREYAMRATQFKDAQKKKLTETEKQGVAANFLASNQEFLQRGLTGVHSQDDVARYNYLMTSDPQKVAADAAEGYAYAAEQGWTETERMEYANASAVDRFYLRAKKGLGRTYDSAATSIGNAIGSSTFAERAGNWRAWGDTDQQIRDKAFKRLSGQEAGEFYGGVVAAATKDPILGAKVNEWLSDGKSPVGTAVASVDAALGDTIDGFLSPDNVAIFMASHKLGNMEEASVGIQRVARTIQGLAHAGFTAQMAEGAGDQFEAARHKFMPDESKGETQDIGEGIGLALSGILSGYMATSGMRESVAKNAIQRDLDAKTAEMFGVPAEPLMPSVTTGAPQARQGPVQEAKFLFHDLNDYQQSLVIDKMIQDSPEYQKAADASQKQMAKNAKKLERKYSSAMAEAWHPNAITRIKQEIATADAKQEQTERRNATVEARRRLRKLVESKNRKIDAATAEQVSKGREQAQEMVEDHRQRLETSGEPIRHEVYPAGDGVYAGTHFGEEAQFGVVKNLDGTYSVVTQSGAPESRMFQVLTSDGEFTDSGEGEFQSHDPKVADALAKIASVNSRIMDVIANDTATPEQEAAYAELSQARQSLIGGEAPEEVLRRVGIRQEIEAPSQVQAVVDGNLMGPLHETERDRQARQQAIDRGETPLTPRQKFEQELEEFLPGEGARAPLYIRQQAEEALHFVHASGDYLVASDGRTWTLDDKGLMHPDDGGRPVPLMKDGRYTNQALQMAETGRVGTGLLTREARIAEAKRTADIAAAVESIAPEIEQAIIVAQQSRGLETAAQEPTPVQAKPAAKVPPSFVPEREPEDPYYEQLKADTEAEQQSAIPVMSLAEQVASSIEKSDTSLWGRVKGIAQSIGVDPNELVGRVMFSGVDLDTPEGQAAQLRPGDKIATGRTYQDPETGETRETSPYVIEAVKGNRNLLKLRYPAGNNYSETFDPHKPPAKLIQAIQAGRVEFAPRIPTEADLQRVIDSPVVVNREAATKEIEAIAKGDIVVPEPKTPEQAQAGIAHAKTNSQEAHAAATEAVVKATSPTAATTETETDKAIQEAMKARKTAERAHVQVAEAKGRAEEKADFPELAPITSKGVNGREGFVGGSGIIAQGDRTEPFHYELVPFDSIIPSHLWNGKHLVRNERYQPTQMQPRTFDEGEEEANWQRAENYRPSDYLQDTNGPERGPTIIEPGGRPVGGNTRHLIRRKHLENIREDEIALALFNDDTRRFARRMGITQFPDDGQVWDVVRVLDNPPATLGKAIELANMFNEDTSVRLDKNVAAVTNARLLSEARVAEGEKPVLEQMAIAIADADTVRAAIDKSPTFFAKIVRDYLHIPRTEEKDWFKNSDNGEVLSDDGKDKLELALIATNIKDTETLKAIQGTQAFRSLGKSVGSLSALRAFPERDITGAVTEAVNAAGTVQAWKREGDTPRQAWNRTYDHNVLDLDTDVPGLSKPVEPSRFVHAVWLAMNDPKPTTLNRALSDMVAASDPNMDRLFAVQTESGDELRTPADRFNAAFKAQIGKLKSEAEDIGREFYPITQAEFDAAREGRPFTDEMIREANGVAKSEVKKGERSEKSEQEAGGGLASTPANETIEAKPNGKMERPPKAAPKVPKAEKVLAAAKSEKGYVTPEQLKEFLELHPVLREQAPELLRTTKLMAEYVWEADRPIGVDKKDALAWILKARVSELKYDAKETQGRGSYSDPNIVSPEGKMGDAVLRMHKSADASTWIHETAHAIFPMLSDEDLKAIDTIHGETGRVWNGKGKLSELAYRALTEKFAHAMEKFLRDENPTGFSEEVKAVLAKVKQVMQNIYADFRGDPLSAFEPTDEAREVFAKMFKMEDFDQPDRWSKKKASILAERNRMKKPSETPLPIQEFASQEGGTIQKTFVGTPYRIDGDVVKNGTPPTKLKNTSYVTYPTVEAALQAVARLDDAIGKGKAPIKGYEMWRDDEGKAAISFDDGGKLYQSLPEKEPRVKLVELEERLKSEARPFFQAMIRKQIEDVKNQIRSDAGVEPREVKSLQAEALAARKEVLGGDTDRGRVPESVSGSPKFGNFAEDYRLARMGMPRYEKSRGERGAERAPVRAVKDVQPLTLEPLGERGEAVGVLHGEPFDQKSWDEDARRSGRSQGSPAPTYRLSQAVADKMKYPGQKAHVQLAMSAFEQGDGFLLASATGTGKSFVAMGVVKEFLTQNPDAKILVITKNQTLLFGDEKKSLATVAKETFGIENFEVKEPPDAEASKGVYGTTYSGLRSNAAYAGIKWDLVVADESGEARNWYQQPEPVKGKPAKRHQGQLLRDVANNSDKVMYVSATPFHAPMEYGYLDKLNLWPKGGFDDWIRKNFNARDAGGKLTAEIDPGKQMKLRQQLIERGQMSTQTVNYEGFTAHLATVTMTPKMEVGLRRIHDGVAIARQRLLRDGKEGLAQKLSAFEATYTKAYLERERISEAIQLASQAYNGKYRVAFYSETTADDLFRRERDINGEIGRYQELDDEMGGRLGQIMPEFKNVYDELQDTFGNRIGNYSGYKTTDRSKEDDKQAFMTGKKPFLYTTYASGGIGLSLHDETGNMPTVVICLGPPYSGMALEQTMGRFWRFGVKSNVHMVFLATDAEPDIRLLATKVGPRLRAVNASVRGENDSLGTVMGKYSDEEKMREYQDMLAYNQGNEMKVDALSAIKKNSSRDVKVANWSEIKFPDVETQKNKGMRMDVEGADGDWTTVYQKNYRMNDVPNPENAKAEKAINEVADNAAKNPDIPRVTIASGAANAAEVANAAPDGFDKAAAGKQYMEASIEEEGYLQDPETGAWKASHEQLNRMKSDDKLGEDEKSMDSALGKVMAGKEHYNLSTLGMPADMRFLSMARHLGAEDTMQDIINMQAGLDSDRDGVYGDLQDTGLKVFSGNGLDHTDKATMVEVIDVAEGTKTSDDPKINKAAEDLRAWFADAYDKLDKSGFTLIAQTGKNEGKRVPWAQVVPKNTHYFTHITDWDMKLTDSRTGETKTLREMLDNKTLTDADRLRYLEGKRVQMSESEQTKQAWLDQLKRDRKRMKTPALDNLTKQRKMNHPFYRKDIGALDRYAKQVAMAVALEQNFGSDMGKLRKAVAKVPNWRMRQDILSIINTQFENRDLDTIGGAFLQVAQPVEAMMKMTLSPISVLTHPMHASLALGRVTPLVKGTLRFLRHPRELMREKYAIGVVAKSMNPQLIEGRGALTRAFFHVSGFDGAYRMGRAIIGETANVWMVQDALPNLIKFDKLRRSMGEPSEGNTVNVKFKSEDVTRRLLKNTMLIGDAAIDQAIASGKWDQDSLERAQRSFTNKVAFSDNPLQMPMAARESMDASLSTTQKNYAAAARAAYTMQSFGIKTYGLLKERLFDEVVIHGNMRPLIPFLLLYPAAGVALQAAKAGTKNVIHKTLDKATGKETRDDDWERYLERFKDIEKHPWIAPLEIYLDGILTQAAMERTKRWGDLIMLYAMGKTKLADSRAGYMLDDEMEQTIGAIWGDLFAVGHTAEQAFKDYRHTKTPSKKLPAAERDIAKEAEQLVPITRTIPWVNRMAHPPRQQSANPNMKQPD